MKIEEQKEQRQKTIELQKVKKIKAFILGLSIYSALACLHRLFDIYNSLM